MSENTTHTTTSDQILREAYIASDLDALTIRRDIYDNTILSVGRDYLAAGDEYDGDTLWGFTWTTGLHATEDEQSEDITTDGGQDPEELRAAVAAWLAQF